MLLHEFGHVDADHRAARRRRGIRRAPCVSSVLPTPVGPRNRNDPSGRFGSCKPARARRTAADDRLHGFVLADHARADRRLPSGATSRARLRSSARPGCRSSGDDRGDILVGRLPRAAWRPWSRPAPRRVASRARGCGRIAARRPWRDRHCAAPARVRAAAASSCSLILASPAILSFSACQRWVSSADCCSRLASSSSSLARRSFDASSGLLLQRLALDLELDDAAVEILDFLGLGFDLHADAARRLVHQVDRLVGQKAVGDVAVAERRRGDHRGVGDAHAVVELVFLLQPAQDRDGVVDRRLADEHRLEAAFERGVFLDMLAIFVERGRADAVQFAAGKRRLEQVRASIAPSALPAPTSVCISSMNRMISPAACLTSSSTRLQALLEFAAIFRAGDQRAHDRAPAGACS